jgi:ketosteroid isomerase-like protein
MRRPVRNRTVSPLVTACVAIAAIAVGCAPAADQEVETPATPVDVSAEIMVANEGFVSAFNAGDGAGVAAMYTDDAVLYPPNGGPVSGGAAALTDFWQGVLDTGIARGRLETVEAEGMGDTAVEVGRFTLLGADGGTIDRGSYMVLWKKTDAGWRLHRDIWNSDLALAP